MGKLIPEWRLREIRNIADSIAFHSSNYPASILVNLAEEKYLKPSTHIRLFIHPGLKIGEALHYVQHFKKAKDVYAEYEVDVFQVTIYFNGDLTTVKGWKKTMRAVVRELGWVIFFSPAAKRPMVVRGEEEQVEMVKIFTNKVLEGHLFAFSSSRPRFTLAKLREIVEKEFSTEAGKEILPYLAKFLRPYLGPDGW